MLDGATSRDLFRITLAATAGVAVGMTLLLLLQARRTSPAPEAAEFQQLARRNERYAG